jgi:hypothetical protein
MSWQQALFIVLCGMFAIGGFVTLVTWTFQNRDDDGPPEPPPGAGGTR